MAGLKHGAAQAWRKRDTSARPPLLKLHLKMSEMCAPAGMWSQSICFSTGVGLSEAQSRQQGKWRRHHLACSCGQAAEIGCGQGAEGCAWAGGQLPSTRELGSENSEGRPSSRSSSRPGSKNEGRPERQSSRPASQPGSTNAKGSEESFDPKTAFVVDLPKSDVRLLPPAFHIELIVRLHDPLPCHGLVTKWLIAMSALRGSLLC